MTADQVIALLQLRPHETEGGWYRETYGMHQFGLEDATVERSLPPKDAADLFNRFNYWRLAQRPTINDGDTFSVAADAPWYRLRKHPCELFTPDKPFHNPFGIWSLESEHARGREQG